MDDVNINGIYLEEIEVNAEGDKWTRVSWKENASDNDEESQSTEKESDIEPLIEETKDNGINEPCTNTEEEDDGIAVISESDEDKSDENTLQVCPAFDSRPQVLRMPKPSQSNDIKINVGNIRAFAFGVIFGYMLRYIICSASASDIANVAESLKSTSSDILNTRKDLEEVMATLNKIKARIPDNEMLLMQLSQLIDFSSQTNRKFSIDDAEYVNEKSRPLNDLRISLHVLSLLKLIYDNNSLQSEISETLNIMNNTMTFYEALISFDNDTQNIHNSAVFKFLQDNGDKIASTSRSFLSDIRGTINKIILHIHKKYIKMRNKLNKKLCHLKNQYPDDKGLKLTENNQLFDDKYCLMRPPQKVNDETVTRDDTIYKKKNKGKKHYNQQDNFFEQKLQDTDDSFILKQTLDKTTTDEVHHKSQAFCPQSTNLCPECNDNVDTADTVSTNNHKIENFYVVFDDKHDEDNLNELARLEALFAKEKSKPIEEDNSEWNISIEKVVNHVDANTERKDVSPPLEIEEKVYKPVTIVYHDQSSNTERTEQDNQQDISPDRQKNDKESQGEEEPKFYFPEWNSCDEKRVDPWKLTGKDLHMGFKHCRNFINSIKEAYKTSGFTKINDDILSWHFNGIFYHLTWNAGMQACELLRDSIMVDGSMEVHHIPIYREICLHLVKSVIGGSEQDPDMSEKCLDIRSPWKKDRHIYSTSPNPRVRCACDRVHACCIVLSAEVKITPDVNKTRKLETE